MGAPARAVIQTLGIIFVAFVGTVWTYNCHPKRPALYLAPDPVPEPGIPLSSVLAGEEAPVWLDARSAAEYEAAHIPEAISLNPENLTAQLPRHRDIFIDRTKTFVIYGPDEAARIVAERLRGLGLPRVEILQGGWDAWQGRKP